MWPFSSFARISSSTDSTALVTNRHPVRASTGSSVAVAQQVLDLDRDVVGQRRMPRVQRLDDAPRVRRAVEEVGIAEGDVLGAGGDLLIDVGEHDVDRHDAELAVVDRHDRAMPAAVLAAARRLGGAGDAPRAVGHLQRGVARRAAAGRRRDRA